MDARDAESLPPLERVPEDVRVAIMSGFDSVQGLGSLIKSSPVFYRTFLSFKSYILVRVVCNILGPVAMDARVLAQTSRFSDEDHDKQTKAGVQKYYESLQKRGASWGSGLRTETVMQLAKWTRIVEYFVDLYILFHLDYFRHNLDQRHAPSTLVERQRIAQALIRYQVLCYMHGERLWKFRSCEFYTQVSGLFESWEMEQVSQMNYFIGALHNSIETFEEIWRNPLHGRYYPKDRALNLTDLGAFHDKLHEISEGVGGGLPKRLSIRYMTHNTEITTYFGTIFLTTGRHAHPGISCPCVNTSTSPSNLEPESPTSPPWAWHDAIHTEKGCGWGQDLIRVPVEQRGNPDSVNEVFRKWRWLGFMFWDKQRSQKLLEAEMCKPFPSGWLRDHIKH
ncbi:hypothetical protein B0I35DRAFT_440737 [Stachybotrys elegans]|uniref:Uncharacterized protein n=1 Tax=Stachybotrys elegans TaxID=80388 RepID=A0A8K0SJS5_9HYPO|nr:hypothetical protein B0I35DRAFT_440737 [Stachybotrys elegans]